MTSRHVRLSLVATCVLVVGSSAMAGLVAYEPFDYPLNTYTGAGTMNSGAGWANAWQCTHSYDPLDPKTGKVLQANDNGGLHDTLTYTGITSSGYTLAGFRDPGVNDYRSLASAAPTTGVLWLTFLRQGSGDDADTGLFQLKSGSTVVLQLQPNSHDKGVKLTVNGALTTNTTGNEVYTSGYQTTTMLQVLKLDYGAGTVSYWGGTHLDVTNESSLGTAVLTASGLGTSAIDSILVGADVYQSSRVDEIRLATDFSSALSGTSVPEPAMLSMACLAGLALVRRRRA